MRNSHCDLKKHYLSYYHNITKFRKRFTFSILFASSNSNLSDSMFSFKFTDFIIFHNRGSPKTAWIILKTLKKQNVITCLSKQLIAILLLVPKKGCPITKGSAY